MRRGFRINAATLELTHVSKRPVVSAYQLRDSSILTVFSHHFISRDSGGTAADCSLLTFFGAGDAQSCYSEVDIASVGWQPVKSGKSVDFRQRDSHKYEL